MATSINTNLASLFAQNSLSNAQNNLASSVQRLSSGLRINSAKDDAAGLSIAQNMQSQINGTNQSIRNLSDATNLLQVADSSLSTVQDMLLRLKQLSVQGFDGSLSASQKLNIVQEMKDLNNEINATAQRTQFNGIKLLTSGSSLDTVNSDVKNGVTLINSAAQVSTTSGLGAGSTLNDAGNTIYSLSLTDSKAQYAPGSYTLRASGNNLTMTGTFQGKVQSQTVALADLVGYAPSTSGLNRPVITNINFSNFGIEMRLTSSIAAGTTETGATLAAAITAKSNSIVVDGKGGQISNVKLSGVNLGTYQMTFGNTGSVSSFGMPAGLVSGQTSAGTARSVALVGGNGSGATANISYDAQGKISSIAVETAGTGYKAGDVLSTAAVSAGTVNAPSVTTTTQGATQTNESATVTFGSLAAGQQMNLGGLIYTAGSSGATANQVANAFANLAAGATTGAGTTAANGSGSYMGTFAGWTTTATMDSGNKVTFNSTTSASNVDNLVQTLAGSATVVATQGMFAATESSVVSFAEGKIGQTISVGGTVLTLTGNASASEVAAMFSDAAAGAVPTAVTGVMESTVATFTDLSVGQSITIGGLTYNATAATTAAQVASAFSNGVTGRVAGAVVDSIVTDGGNNIGTIVGTVGSVGITSTGSTATFASSIVNTNVDDLTVTGTGESTVTLVTTQGKAGGTFAGSLTGFSAGVASGNTVRFTSTSASSNVTDIGVATSGTPTITSTQGGVAGNAETSTVNFTNLAAGQSVTAGGVTYTATTSSSAAEIAIAFQNLASNFDGGTGLAIQNGVLTGTLGSNFSTGAASGTSVTFTSTNAAANVTDLTVTNTIDTPEAEITTAAAVGVSEVTTFTFTKLSAGQSVTAAGLTFTASADTTAVQVASAFSDGVTGRAAGDTVSSVLSTGAISGTVLAGALAAGGTGQVTLTATVTNTALAATITGPTAPSITSTVQGAATGTEQASVVFAALKSGQSLTLGGLTYTATADNNIAAVAAAFASLQAGATTGAGASGTYSGTLSGFSTGTVSGGTTVIFTSSVAGTNVDDLQASAPPVPTVVTNQGSAARQETARVSFSNLNAGQTLTLGGLTFTAGTSGATAAQVGQAFQSLVSGAATGAGTLVSNGSGTYSGALTGWTSATVGDDGSVLFSSTTATGDQTDLFVAQSGSGTSIVRVDGAQLATESARVTFNSANMSTGDSVTIGGLTFTASNDGVTQSQVAAAFSGLAAGTSSANLSSSNGTFSGTLTGWSTGTSDGTGVSFTSATASVGVEDLTASASRRQALNALSGIVVGNLANQTGENLLTMSGLVNGSLQTQALSLKDNAANSTQTLNFDMFGVQFDVDSFQAQTAGEIGAVLASLNSSSANYGTTGAFVPGQVVVSQGANSALKFQSGPDSSSFIQIDTLNIQTGSSGIEAGSDKQMMDVGSVIADSGEGKLGALGLNDSIDTWQTAFINAAAAVDEAIEYVSSKRATYGSQMNRLSFVTTNLTAQSTNLQNSRSAIIDTDFASETAKLTKGQIMQQAATAMLAQANQMPNVILSLLK